ncbi:MAG: hypothetical protein HOU81_12085 [Hamadaea sp.]|uniref:hypothetical protein n=1 Tax=Hamadaea sp. TaxID=2024425 RepID=UPI0017A62144|nr:hypothetical protein [Hamadaea sp.]NUR71550.1 hypothetical protein [Hamadaea sp.]NUT19650.1 hypothetical protein [Hamadaea sp.]
MTENHGPPVPHWDLDGTWLFVGDEVALADHAGEAYGRIVGLDPDGSGLPIVLILAGPGRGGQEPLPLHRISGKRVPADAAARAGGGREDRLWSSSLHDNEGRGWL